MKDNNFDQFSVDPYDFKDKQDGVNQYMLYMLSRTQSMFRYDGLPDTIPARMLELYLQSNGNCIISEVDGNLYAFTGGFGGVRDEYYRPTIYTVTNPYLNLTRMYEIEKDCVLIKNDSMLLGLVPMFQRYSTMMVENDLTMVITSVMSRMTALLTAEDDATARSAELVIKRLFEGDMGVITDYSLVDGIKSMPFANASGNGYMVSLIELQQYIKASWLNDIGLQANFNMKREALNSSETRMNEEALLPFVDDMLRNRREALKRVNEMFGTNISVELASSWIEDYQEELAVESNDSVQTEELGEHLEPVKEDILGEVDNDEVSYQDEEPVNEESIISDLSNIEEKVINILNEEDVDKNIVDTVEYEINTVIDDIEDLVVEYDNTDSRT